MHDLDKRDLYHEMASQQQPFGRQNVVRRRTRLVPTMPNLLASLCDRPIHCTHVLNRHIDSKLTSARTVAYWVPPLHRNVRGNVPPPGICIRNKMYLSFSHLCVCFYASDSRGIPLCRCALGLSRYIWRKQLDDLGLK
jgi:hypothetical protein